MIWIIKVNSKEEFCWKYVGDFSRILLLQMDYINTSHPGFVGGSKAVEGALQQQRGAKVSSSNTSKAKVTACIFICLLSRLFKTLV